MKKVIAKIISLGLVLGMAGAMAACTSKKGTTVKSGTLTMATNAYFPPYEYYEGTDIVGIDAEIAAAIAENKYDIGMAGMTVTDVRKKAVNFSSTYATGIQAVIVPEGSEITDVDTLLGGDYKVGVQQGTTGDIYMTDDVGEDRVVRFSKGNDAVLALSTGKVDAVVIDNEPAKSFVAANAGLVILPTAYVEEEYAMCINKDNKDLLEKINKALEELTADGTIDKIIEKYIPSNG